MAYSSLHAIDFACCVARILPRYVSIYSHRANFVYRVDVAYDHMDFLTCSST